MHTMKSTLQFLCSFYEGGKNVIYKISSIYFLKQIIVYIIFTDSFIDKYFVLFSSNFMNYLVSKSVKI